MAVTPEQQKALAIAQARLRLQAKQSAAPETPTQPEERGVFRRIDDAVRGAADVLSFGLADEIAAKASDLTGIGGDVGTYEENLAAQRQRDREGGVERFAGQVAGAVAVPLRAASSLAGAATQGAALGGAYGFGSGEGDATNRAKNAAAGALVGGAAGGVVHGAANAIANRAARSAMPDQQAVRAAGEAAYKAADEAGVIYTPQAVSRLRDNVVAKLTDFGYDPGLQPGARAALERLQGLEGQNLTLKGLDTIRKVASNGYIPGNKPNNKAVSMLVDSIDEFVASPAADDILAGNAEAGAAALSQARDAWSRLSKSERVTNAVKAAEDRAAVTGSGANIDNTIRQNLRKIVDKPRGFSEAEQAAVRSAARATPARNALRLAGKFAPTGVVSGVLSGGAGMGLAGGPLGLALPLAGAGAKAASDALTRRNAQRLAEMLLSGGQTASDVARLAAGGVGPQGLVNAVQGIRSLEGRISPAMARIAAALTEEAR